MNPRRSNGADSVSRGNIAGFLVTLFDQEMESLREEPNGDFTLPSRKAIKPMEAFACLVVLLELVLGIGSLASVEFVGLLLTLSFIVLSGILSYAYVWESMKLRRLPEFIAAGIDLRKVFLSAFSSHARFLLVSFGAWVLLNALFVYQGKWQTLFGLSFSLAGSFYLFVLLWAASLVGSHLAIGYSFPEAVSLLPNSMFYVHVLPFTGCLIPGSLWLLDSVSPWVLPISLSVGVALIIALLVLRRAYHRRGRALFRLEKSDTI